MHSWREARWKLTDFASQSRATRYSGPPFTPKEPPGTTAHTVTSPSAHTLTILHAPEEAEGWGAMCASPPTNTLTWTRGRVRVSSLVSQSEEESTVPGQLSPMACHTRRAPGGPHTHTHTNSRAHGQEAVWRRESKPSVQASATRVLLMRATAFTPTLLPRSSSGEKSHTCGAGECTTPVRIWEGEGEGNEEGEGKRGGKKDGKRREE